MENEANWHPTESALIVHLLSNDWFIGQVVAGIRMVTLSCETFVKVFRGTVSNQIIDILAGCLGGFFTQKIWPHLTEIKLWNSCAYVLSYGRRGSEVWGHRLFGPEVLADLVSKPIEWPIAWYLLCLALCGAPSSSCVHIGLCRALPNQFGSGV